jgi:hypothetical protein
MIKNILLQQQEERDGLLKQVYVDRIDLPVKEEYLITGLIKLTSSQGWEICFFSSIIIRCKFCISQF